MNLTTLTSKARHLMLMRGRLAPELFLELPSGAHVLDLRTLSSGLSVPAQCGAIARLGWELCKEHPGETPLRAGFYAEAWTVSATESCPQERMHPRKSPARQEVLVVDFWESEPVARYYHHSLSIRRSASGRVVGVGEEAVQAGKPSVQLHSFLQGCFDAQREDEEVFGQMEDLLKKKVARLTPAQKDELRQLLAREGMPFPDDLL